MLGCGTRHTTDSGHGQEGRTESLMDAKKKKSRLLWARIGRLPLLVLGMSALLAGVWGGLVRLPMALPLPPDNANWITFHGPLMVCGFLGTVIGLERAVGLGRVWTYAAPLLTGAGALALLAGVLGRPPQVLILLGSGVFVAVALRVILLQRAAHTILMALAGMAWCVGNVLWFRDWSLPHVAPWWMAFLGLTIVGERLELTRYQKPVAWSRPVLYGVMSLWAVGLACSLAWPGWGVRILGVGMVGASLWLVRFDIARTTVRHPGLPRFMALCLLSGYAWMAVSGSLLVLRAPTESGLSYDAALHAFFLGFVFMMIFAHAPLIFPSVLLWPPLEISRRFWVHVSLLHVSLLLRVGGDLLEWHSGRRWGAILNGVAVGIFLLNTVGSMIAARCKAGGGSARPASFPLGT